MEPIDQNETLGRSQAVPGWTLVTSHGLVLVYVAMNQDATIRQIATALEITERRVADIIRDLAKVDLLLVERKGRRNHYALKPDARFRHPIIADVPFDAFVAWLSRWSGSVKHAQVAD